MGILKSCFFYFSAFLFIFSCSNPEKEKLFDHSSIDTLILKDNSQQIIISSNEKPVSFRLKINNKFPFSIDDMVDSISRISKLKNIAVEQAAWEFVTKNTFHSHPLTEKCRQHNSEIFLNSVGGGLCESRATTLTDLWRKMKFDSRVINLVNYHVVAEVFSGVKWKMYDADNEIYYYNDKNEIASFDELREHPEWVANPGRNYDFSNPYTVRNLWTQKLAQSYSLSEIDTINWEADSTGDVQFSLPPNTNMTFYSENTKNIFSIGVDLNKKSKGFLKIPFVPYAAIGNFSFRSADSTYVLNDNDTLFFHSNELIKKLNITDVKTPSQIIYLVNPRLNILRETTIVTIEGTEDLNVSLGERNEKTAPQFLPNRIAVERLFLDSVLNAIYLDYLINSAPYAAGNIDNYFNSEFEKFLDSDNSLSAKDKELFLKKFPELLQKYLSELGSSKEEFISLLNKYHPMSLYYLFSSVRYDKSEFLKETWRKHIDSL